MRRGHRTGKKYGIPVLLALIALTMAGCGKRSDDTSSPAAMLKVETTRWADGADTVRQTCEYPGVKRGDVIYEGFGTSITVKRVYSDHLSFRTGGGLIEPNEDGTLNFSAPSVKEFQIKADEEITLHTMTMDAGEEIVIRYETIDGTSGAGTEKG
ncbi:MAG: hypothetical protein K6G16_10685 [Lachnospiraceae bacterium]|nr:hypothetical protein [Lachnospiraceae bacterium]